MSAQRGTAYRWLPDDTEEGILGAEWHQDAISSLCTGLREVARAQGWPWHVGNQMTLLAWHPDGTPWRPKPDIMVHPGAGVGAREEMSGHTDGLPALIVEVASRTTYRSDIMVEAPTRERPEAKGYEYLVFDPTGEHVAGQVRAWRGAAEGGTEWQPDDEGRYVSRELGVSFRPEGLFLRIYDPAGAAVPFDHERAGMTARLVAQLEQERAEAQRRAAQSEQEIAALRAQIEQLRGGSENG